LVEGTQPVVRRFRDEPGRVLLPWHSPPQAASLGVALARGDGERLLWRTGRVAMTLAQIHGL
jgi:hypothetical protein